VHRGGKTAQVELDEEYQETVVRAAQIMGLRVAGVDMLEGKDGPQIMEVNSSPGLEWIERCTHPGEIPPTKASSRQEAAGAGRVIGRIALLVACLSLASGCKLFAGQEPVTLSSVSEAPKHFEAKRLRFKGEAREDVSGRHAWRGVRGMRSRAPGHMRYMHVVPVVPEGWTRDQPVRTVVTTLQMFGVPSAPMLIARDQLHDVHFQARGYPRWIEQQDLGWICLEGPAFRASGMADVHVAQAPKLGEHTRAICRELLGLDDERIEALVAEGVLEVPEG